MVIATALYRGSHLVAGGSVVTQHQRDRPFPWLALVAAIAATALIWFMAARHRRLVSWAVGLDVLVIGCLLPFGAYAWGGARTQESIAWVMLLGGSASAMAAVAFGARLLAVAVVLLVATHLAGYLLVEADAAVTGAHLNALVFSAVVSWVLTWYLCRQGEQVDAANRRALDAEAQRARFAERVAHHNALHDTVLATLTAIARGGVDANTSMMRERCAREAAYLRRLVEEADDREHASEVRGALEESVRAAEALGLRVTARYHALPAVPGEIALTMARAATEALNNVRCHAGTGHAFLTAAGDSGRLVVTVVDRGRGFAMEGAGRQGASGPAGAEASGGSAGAEASGGSVVRAASVPPATGGIGLDRCVYARMRGVGGRALVDSAPGEGVRVELRWPG
ncbi:sensor histidine kinase [Streptomyces parvus]|uniref:sensor histidine kinase n=1 Tax=Streptomyces parvus TaxID=66428 RepID=UPI0033F6463C